MNESTSSFESELRASPKPVLIVLMVLGPVFFFTAEVLSCSWVILERLISFSLLLSGLSVAAWLLLDWKPVVGRWFTIVAMIAGIYAGGHWLELSSFLAFIPIPVILAAALISPPAAAATAIAETLWILLWPNKIVTGDGWVATGVVLTAVWTALGALHVVYCPIRQLSQWLEEYFDHAQHFLGDARARKAELEQAMKNLGYANRRLALTTERMAALRAIAQEARQAKASFVAKVSHEFRTPLNMIIGLTEVMAETPEIYDVALSPKMREDLEVVRRNSEHLSDMINDVLYLSQIEADRLALHRESVDLREILARSVVAVRPLIEKKQLALQITVPDDLSTVYCDETRVEQVVLNLVSNAVRFTEAGGVAIEVTCQGQHVLISVSDTGPGIAPEDLERIFEPFYQGGHGLWRDKGGSGLGLTISKQFVELHGGGMWLESELGVGTTFFFTLPTSLPEEHIVGPGRWIKSDWVWREDAFTSARTGSEDQLVRPYVILCDENDTLHAGCARYCDEIEFVHAGDLAQVVQELQHCPAHAVVLNATTSDETWSLAERARQEMPGTPVVICSVPRPIQRAVDAGALGHLTKPVTRVGLEKAIQTVGKPVRRVLVVDDDPDALRLFTRMLRACDSTLEIVTASSGEQALEELRDAPPDLALLDIVMPDMDGWQLLESMGQDRSIEDVPVFFVSANDPVDYPLVSEFLLTTIDRGIPLSRLPRYSLEVSALLLKTEKELGPVHAQTRGVALASTDRRQRQATLPVSHP